MVYQNISGGGAALATSFPHQCRKTCLLPVSYLPFIPMENIRKGSQIFDASEIVTIEAQKIASSFIYY